MSKKPRLRVAVIGAGGISRDEHIPAWLGLSEVEVAAVVDPSPAARKSVKTRFGLRCLHEDYRHALEDRSIAAVDICVPSALHAEVSIAALAAGKHVLCEKPMATSRSDAARMLDAWRQSGTRLMIAQHLRFDHRIESLRRFLAHDSAGQIYYARAQWMRRRRLPGTPGFTQRSLSGGGVLYDLGVHMLDLAWWMMGCPAPTRASGGTFRHLIRRGDLGSEWGEWDPTTIDVEDFAAGMIRFADGSVLSLEVSWLALQRRKEFRRLQLFGTRAGVEWPKMHVAGETDRVPWDLQLEPVDHRGAHADVVRAFARSILDDTPVAIPPTESANVIAMLEALYRSSASGAEVPTEGFEM